MIIHWSLKRAARIVGTVAFTSFSGPTIPAVDVVILADAALTGRQSGASLAGRQAATTVTGRQPSTSTTGRV